MFFPCAYGIKSQVKQCYNLGPLYTVFEQKSKEPPFFIFKKAWTHARMPMT